MYLAIRPGHLTKGKSPVVGRAMFQVPSTDQRGHGRPSKHADAGAFELPKKHKHWARRRARASDPHTPGPIRSRMGPRHFEKDTGKQSSQVSRCLSRYSTAAG